MRHKSKNKTRPLFTLSLEMTRLVNETRLLLVPGVNSDIYGICSLSPDIQIKKHCVLICNTPPLMHHSTGSLTYAGKNYKQMVKLMTEVGRYVCVFISNLLSMLHRKQ